MKQIPHRFSAVQILFCRCPISNTEDWKFGVIDNNKQEVTFCDNLADAEELSDQWNKIGLSDEAVDDLLGT